MPEWDAQVGVDGKPLPQTLRGFLRHYGWRGPQGPIQRALRDALRRLMKRGKEDFTLREIMGEVAFKVESDTNAPGRLDYDDYGDRTATAAYLHSQRGVLTDALKWFWTLPVYQKYVDDGYTDKTVFKRFVEALVSFDIYPLEYDQMTKKHHLLTLEGVARIAEQRALAMRNEFVSRVEEMATLEQKFPALKDMFTPPALPTDGRYFIELPGDRNFRCGIDHLAFTDEASLERHKARRHPEIHDEGKK